jgi:NADPH:quinone reductase-like Zn-dependent oxidoreductase
MLAAVCTAYGGPDVVEVRNVPAPVAGRGEVLVRIRAATVDSGDARIRASRFPSGLWLPGRIALGITRPRQPVLGTALAGIVEAVGPEVTRFERGDAVFASTGMAGGCHAQFRTMSETAAICRAPAGLPLEEAAAIPFGGLTALHFLRDVAHLRLGERVLVNGASGAVGVAAVQLARHMGAHVTGVCSETNAARVRSLGANAIIHHRTTDFTSTGEHWDVVLDAIGNAPYARSRNALSDNGRLLMLVAGLGGMLSAFLRPRRGRHRVLAGTSPDRAEDLAFLKGLCEANELRAVIDSRYPLAQIDRAHARVDTGRKVGSVVVALDQR